MVKPMYSCIWKGSRIFLAAGLILVTPLVVYSQDAPCKPLEEKILMLEKVIEELGDANAMLLQNLSACVEENRDLSEKLENVGKKPDPVKSK